MGKLTRLFKHTFIYGIATVLPRVLGLFLTPLYIGKLSSEAEYGVYSVIMSYMILGNVIFSYGMETAFFRFWNTEKNPLLVCSTALVSLMSTSVVVGGIVFLGRDFVAQWLHLEAAFVEYAITILVLDAWVVIPFAWLRARGKSLHYAGIKIANVTINLLLNILFFLVLSSDLPADISQVHYIFISNVVASLFTFFMVLGIYRRIGFSFDVHIWKKMLRYAFPVLVAGVAFSINEGFDRIFLRILLPPSVADTEVGIYAACYKMGVFMTLFITAYRLGVEPFFFSNAKDKNAPHTYASVTLYFVIFGAFILLFISVFSDIFKRFLIPNSQYWSALWIVPYILLANLCLGVYHSLSVWYKVTDRTHYGAYISVVGSLITIAMNFLLIPIMGYKGAAVATLGAYASMMFASYVLGQKKYPIPYDIRRIAIYLSYSVIASWWIFFQAHRNWIWGVLALLGYVGLVFFLQRKEMNGKRLFSLQYFRRK